jgi:hypothetical protein
VDVEDSRSNERRRKKCKQKEILSEKIAGKVSEWENKTSKGNLIYPHFIFFFVFKDSGGVRMGGLIRKMEEERGLEALGRIKVDLSELENQYC